LNTVLVDDSDGSRFGSVMILEGSNRFLFGSGFTVG